MGKKIVLDTSVLIAGILGVRESREILLLILNDKLKILLSDEVFEEYAKAVHYPKIASKVSNYFLSYILSSVYTKAEHLNPKVTINLCRDTKDNMFLSLAVAGNAYAIVSWDKDILSLRDNQKQFAYTKKVLYILTPMELLSILKNEK